MPSSPQEATTPLSLRQESARADCLCSERGSTTPPLFASHITAWKQAKADEPVGICGPVGPTEQLPLVARLVNELGIDLRHAHFWGMDEWYEDGREVPVTHPLSFERADRELCFDRIRPELRMPEANLHFPKGDVDSYEASWQTARCAVMQGGQGDVKHWAFTTIRLDSVSPP